MKKLIEFINNDKEKEDLIIKIFKESYFYDFKHYDLTEFYIIIENDNYIIFQIIEKESFERIKNENKNISKKIEDKKQLFLVYSIFSFTKNKGYATKNLLRLIEIAKKENALIIIDTYNKDLIKITLKEEFKEQIEILREIY